MKFYSSEKSGSYYFIKDNELHQTPMNANDGIVDFNESCGIDFECLEEKDKTELKEIERLLKL